MDKHYVLDIQYAGKAFARLEMFTPGPPISWSRRARCSRPHRVIRCSSAGSANAASFYQSGAQGITVLGESLALTPFTHAHEVKQ